MPIRIRESHIRARISDVQRQATATSSPEESPGSNAFSVDQIVDLVFEKVMKKLKNERRK